VVGDPDTVEGSDAFFEVHRRGCMNASTTVVVIVELSHGHLYLISRVHFYGYGASKARYAKRLLLETQERFIVVVVTTRCLPKRDSCVHRLFCDQKILALCHYPHSRFQYVVDPYIKSFQSKDENSLGRGICQDRWKHN
jgi:hypothetical protein